MLQQINIGEDNLVELDELRLAATGALVSDATVAATLFAADGVTSVATATLTATATAGQYQGSLAAASLTALVAGDFYVLRITASGTAQALRRLKLLAGYHRELP